MHAAGRIDHVRQLRRGEFHGFSVHRVVACSSGRANVRLRARVERVPRPHAMLARGRGAACVTVRSGGKRSSASAAMKTDGFRHAVRPT